jgi:hypothetical protein
MSHGNRDRPNLKTSLTVEPPAARSTATAILIPGPAPATIDHSLPGRLFVLGTVAGGVLLGGFLVGGLTFAGRLSGHVIFANTAVLFLLGCGLGSVPAVLLGIFGCPIGMQRREAGRALLRGLLFLVPTLAIAAVLSGWIAMARIALHLQSPVLLAGAGVAWLLGLGVLVLATSDGAICMQNIWRRWSGTPAA